MECQRTEVLAICGLSTSVTALIRHCPQSIFRVTARDAALAATRSSAKYAKTVERRRG